MFDQNDLILSSAKTPHNFSWYLLALILALIIGTLALPTLGLVFLSLGLLASLILLKQENKIFIYSGLIILTIVSWQLRVKYYFSPETSLIWLPIVFLFIVVLWQWLQPENSFLTKISLKAKLLSSSYLLIPIAVFFATLFLVSNNERYSAFTLAVTFGLSALIWLIANLKSQKNTLIYTFALYFFTWLFIPGIENLVLILLAVLTAVFYQPSTQLSHWTENKIANYFILILSIVWLQTWSNFILETLNIVLALPVGDAITILGLLFTGLIYFQWPKNLLSSKAVFLLPTIILFLSLILTWIGPKFGVNYFAFKFLPGILIAIVVKQISTLNAQDQKSDNALNLDLILLLSAVSGLFLSLAIS